MRITKYATCGHGSLGIEPSDVTCTYKFNIYVIACEQALRGALVVGWEKEGEHATWLSASKKLMWDAEFAEMTLVMMSLPLTRFWMFVYICARFCFALIGRKSDSSVEGAPPGKWRWNSNSREAVATPPSFSCPATRAPRRTCSQAIMSQSGNHFNNKNLSCNIAQSVFFVWSPILLLIFMSELHWFCSSNWPLLNSEGAVVLPSFCLLVAWEWSWISYCRQQTNNNRKFGTNKFKAPLNDIACFITSLFSLLHVSNLQIKPLEIRSQSIKGYKSAWPQYVWPVWSTKILFQVVLSVKVM